MGALHLKGGSLYLWVLAFILFGVGCGLFFPEFSQSLKPGGEWFVLGIKFFVFPLVFASLADGILRAGGGKGALRVGLKSFFYFEVVSTFALLIGLIAGNWIGPGRGFPVDLSSLDPSLTSAFTGRSPFSLNPLRGINMIQALCFGVLTGVGGIFLKGRARRTLETLLKRISSVSFSVISKYMLLAPIAAFCAISFTIGKFGLGSLRPLAGLMICFYASCLFFILIVLGGIARLSGFSIFSFLKHIRQEILLVLGTSSSESAMAPLMERLNEAGCSPRVTGMVVPAGYALNLDGTNLYLTLATLFIAQAFGVELGFDRQASIFLIAMATSKGASGVTGAGFITLAATLAVVPEIPSTGLVLILGVDRFMSEARAVTNMIGNGVATLVISKWEGALDSDRRKRFLGGR